MRTLPFCLAMVACRAPEPAVTPPVVRAPVAPAVDVAPAATAPSIRVDEAPPDGTTKWAKEVHVQQGRATVVGRLPPEVVQRVVRSQFGAFRACAERAKPRATIRCTATFTIERSGAVAKGAAVTTEVDDPVLGACVLKQVNELSFPPPDSDRVEVTFPLIFARDAAGAPSRRP